MVIKNYSELATTHLREVALKIAERGLEAIETKSVVKRSVRLKDNSLIIADKEYLLSEIGKIVVVGVGKCAVLAASALQDILGDKISSGVVLDVKENSICEFNKIECISGTHPLPSEANVKATKKIINTLSGLSENDLCFFIISGGGSTLLCQPEEGTSYINEKVVMEGLISLAAPIGEINIIRRHMSLARGGYLAKYAYPAKVASLIFSDVPDNDLNTIASGPTVKDPTTIEDADKILAKYNVLEKCGLKHCGLVETPKEDKYFKNVSNTIVVSNEKALVAMKDEAEKLGFQSSIKSTTLIGEAKEAGLLIATALKQVDEGQAMLYGGETTVTLTTPGRGGRNQELALAALEEIGQAGSGLILTLASDGCDNGEYAGAIVDAETSKKAKSMGLEGKVYLDQHFSTDFFEKTNDLLITGNTGSNVSDLTIALK